MADGPNTDAKVIIDAILDGLFICTTGGKIIFSNAAFAKMLRFSEDELLSKSIPKDLACRELEWKAMISLLEQGSPVCDYEMRLRTSDGGEICAAVSASFMRDQESSSTQIVGVARDISTRKAIENELKEKAFRADTLNRMATIATTNLDIRRTFSPLSSELGKAIAFDTISVGVTSSVESGHVEVFVPDESSGEAKRIGIVPFHGSIVEAVSSSMRAIVADVDGHRKGFTEFKVLDGEEINSFLAVPIISRGRVLGSVNLTHSDQFKFTDGSAQTLQAAADIVAGMVENIDLMTSLGDKLKLLNALLQTGVELQRIISTDQIYAAIASHLKEVVPYDDLSFYLVDWQNQRIFPVYAAGGYTDEIMANPGSIDDGVVGAIAKSGKAEMIDDIDLDPRAEQIPGTPSSHDSMMGIPLVGSQGVIGVLELYRPQGMAFTNTDLEAGMLFAQQASVALENAMLVEKLQDSRKEVELLNDLMFHDINNFNFATMNYIDFVSKSGSLAPDSREKINKALHLIRQNARLIDAVKKLSRIGIMDPADFVSVDLADVLRKVVSGVENAFPEKRLSISLDAPDSGCHVMANALIDELFVNLLSNAVKFDPHDEVEVDVECRGISEEGRPSWKVCVADRGPGIPDESRSKLFEKYARLTPHNGVHGTGLGLSICKALTDKFGGRIWVEDRVAGKSQLGARFCVVFPAARHR